MNLGKVVGSLLFAIFLVSSFLFVNATRVIPLTTTTVAKSSSLEVNNGCPVRMTIKTTGRGRLDFGWTGLSHDLGLGTGIVTHYQVSNCEFSNGHCTNCTISGPIEGPAPTSPEEKKTKRCSLDTSQDCSVDTDCSSIGKGSCKFFAGGPMPIVAGGVARCTLNEYVPGHSGTFNMDTQDGLLTNFPVISHIYSAISIDQPCPVCDDTKVPAQCVGGLRNTHSCNPKTSTEYSLGKTNLDCPPAGTERASISQNMAPIGTKFNDPQNSDPNVVSWVKSALNPFCSDYELPLGTRCFVGTCSGNSSKVCSKNTDCDPSGAVLCVGSGGFPSRPHACLMKGFVFEDGTVSAGCVQKAGAPAGIGECDYGGEIRSCFVDNGNINDTISAKGSSQKFTQGTAKINLATVYGSAPSGDGVVNQVVGLPGIAKMNQEAVATLYDSANNIYGCPLELNANNCALASKGKILMSTKKGVKSYAAGLSFVSAAGSTPTSLFGNFGTLEGTMFVCTYSKGILIHEASLKGNGYELSGLKPWDVSKPLKQFVYSNVNDSTGIKASKLTPKSIVVTGSGDKLILPEIPKDGSSITVQARFPGAFGGGCWMKTMTPPKKALDGIVLKLK